MVLALTLDLTEGAHRYIDLADQAFESFVEIFGPSCPDKHNQPTLLNEWESVSCGMQGRKFSVLPIKIYKRKVGSKIILGHLREHDWRWDPIKGLVIERNPELNLTCSFVSVLFILILLQYHALHESKVWDFNIFDLDFTVALSRLWNV